MVLLLLTTGLALAIVLAFTALELLGRHQTSRLAGFTFIAVGSILAGLLTNVLQTGWQSLGIQPLVVLPVRGVLGDAVTVFIGILFYDFMAYWNHRFLHRYLWPVHSLHHSATDLCAANDYAHFTERGIRFLLFALPLSLVKFDLAATPAIALLAISTLEIYIHSSARLHLGLLRGVLVDNRFHRIHHSMEERHFDKNFGILFSFWDRIFGTAYEPGEEWPETGLLNTPPPAGVGDYLIFPLRQQILSRRTRKDGAATSGGACTTRSAAS